MMSSSSQGLHVRRQQRRLIIGGHNIERGRYPYFASIDKNNGVVLNGALIAPDIVLSAGHIATNHMDNLTLKLGTYSIHTANASSMEEIRVEGWIMHANWSQFAPEFFANDFCILKLAQSSSIAPVRLNRDPLIPVDDSSVRMLGLGWTNASYSSPSSIVQEVELRTIGSAACENTTDPSRGISYGERIVPSMLCTVAPPNTTRDGCAWDSGAPVLVADTNDPSEDLLVALGSTGVECADPVFPSIQARVSDGYDWIEEQVCKLSANPPSYFNCDKDKHNVTKSNATDIAPTSAPSAAIAPAPTGVIVPVEQPDAITAPPSTIVPQVVMTDTSSAPSTIAASIHFSPLNATSTIATEGQRHMSMVTSVYQQYHHHGSDAHDVLPMGSLVVVIVAMALVLVLGAVQRNHRRQRREHPCESARLVNVSKPTGYGAVRREENAC